MEKTGISRNRRERQQCRRQTQTSESAASQRQCERAAADSAGFLDVYAHSRASLGCTAVATGSPHRMQDWIVWNFKDKYRQACFRAGSPGDGVDNACRFARPEVRSLNTVVSISSVVGDSNPGRPCGCAARTALPGTERVPTASLAPRLQGSQAASTDRHQG